MDNNNSKKTITIVAIVIALVVGVGLAAFLLLRQQQPAAPPVPTPKPASNIILSVSQSAVAASSSAALDVYINTNGTKIDSFQFIATLNGTAIPVVVDSDPSLAGIQISSAEIAALTVATNSVVAGTDEQTVRFAMITKEPSQSFSSTSPVKVATIPFTPTTAGTVHVEFNTQNTRVNKTGSTEETLMTAQPQTFQLSAPTAAAPASGSASLAGAPTPTPITQTSGTSLSCNSVCGNDNDCAIGQSCMTGRCRNPACSTSTTCVCIGAAATSSGSLSSSPTPTPVALVTSTTPTPLPTATASVSATPVVTVKPTTTTSTISALPDELPKSGAIENTLLLLFAGSLCIGVSAYLILRG